MFQVGLPIRHICDRKEHRLSCNTTERITDGKRGMPGICRGNRCDKTGKRCNRPDQHGPCQGLPQACDLRESLRTDCQ